MCENPNDLDLTTKEFKTILGDILQKLLKEHLDRAEQIELVVLKHLLNEEDYARRTLPYLKSEYFSEMNEKKYLSRNR